MYEKIYKIKFDEFLLLMLPVRLRRIKMAQWLNCLIFPVMALHSSFLAYRFDTNYKLGHTSQVFSMEDVLNDAFDNLLRRIYIKDGIYRFPVWFFDRADGKPVPFFDREDDEPVRFFDRESLQLIDVDFVVVLPIGLNLSEPEMIRLRAMVDFYRLPDKTYTVNYG